MRTNKRNYLAALVDRLMHGDCIVGPEPVTAVEFDPVTGHAEAEGAKCPCLLCTEYARFNLPCAWKNPIANEERGKRISKRDLRPRLTPIDYPTLEGYRGYPRMPTPDEHEKAARVDGIRKLTIRIDGNALGDAARRIMQRMRDLRRMSGDD